MKNQTTKTGKKKPLKYPTIRTIATYGGESCCLSDHECIVPKKVEDGSFTRTGNSSSNGSD